MSFEKIGYSPDGIKRVWGFEHTEFGARAQCEMAARHYLQDRLDVDHIMIDGDKITRHSDTD